MEDKVPLNIVQGILGHASIETTRKYLHKNEDIEREAIGTMSNYLHMDQMDAAPKLNGAAPRQVRGCDPADLSAAPKSYGLKRKNAPLHTLLQTARKINRQHPSSAELLNHKIWM